MTELERKTAAIAAIAENFGKEITPELLKIWLRLLSRYTPEQVEAGAVRVIETYAYKTMPPFAVFKEAVEEVAGGGQKAVELAANAEWNWVLNRASEGVLYDDPKEVHPTTAYVVRIMGGWGCVGQWDMRYLDIKRREFIDLWTQADGKLNVLALGAAGVQRAIEQTHGGFTRIGEALPTAVLQPLGAKRLTDASAVATQEATDEGSNGLHDISCEEPAVAIPKPRGLGKGWREDSNWALGQSSNGTAVAIRKPRSGATAGAKALAAKQGAVA